MLPTALVKCAMPTLLQNKVQELTADQQHAIAEVELARFRRRERLLRESRNYPARRWLSLVFFVLALCIAGKSIELPYQGVAFSLLAVVFALIHLHVAGVNRRVDALLALLDIDGKPVSKNEDP